MKLKPLLTLCFVVASTHGCHAAPTLSTLPPQSVVATWNFDKDATPQTANGWGAELISGTPRFAPGLNGRGVLIEEKSRNLLAPAAAAATDVKAFESLRGAALTVEKNGELSTLRVRADGKQERQGFQVKTTFPADETASWAVASLEIGGSGRVAVQLIDETNYTVGAPLFVELKSEMTRVSPPPIEVVVPGGELRLRITSADKLPLDLRVAQLQVEPLQVATSWLPGGAVREAQALEYSVSHPTADRKTGTLLMWAKPNWTNRTEPALGSGKERQARTFFSYRAGTTGIAQSWTIYGGLNSGNTNLGGVNMFNGGWHLIALTWDGTKGLMYFDGNIKETKLTSVPAKATVTFGPIINATLDEAALLSTPLTKEQLDKIFAAGKPAATSDGTP
jgi:hypothetical protein